MNNVFAEVSQPLMNHDVLQIVWLHPDFRYSDTNASTLRRKLRALDTRTADWYRRWQAVNLLQEIYNKVIRDVPPTSWRTWASAMRQAYRNNVWNLFILVFLPLSRCLSHSTKQQSIAFLMNSSAFVPSVDMRKHFFICQHVFITQHKTTTAWISYWNQRHRALG